MTAGPLAPATLDTLLALNAAHEVETSPLDRDALERLVAMAFHVGLAGDHGADGFVIAMPADCAYDSPNYRWFAERHARFVYIDRVIVSPRARGRGIARALYADLFERARAAAIPLVGCEVNVVPPNPASMAFHTGLGFATLGHATLAGGTKTVAYLGRDPAAPDAG